MGIESFDWSLEVELSENLKARRESEKQVAEPNEELLEVPREIQSVGAEQYSALKDSYSSSAGARLLRTDLSFSQNTSDKVARRNLKKRLDLNTWREELVRRDDNINHLQPNVAPTRTETVTSATKQQMPPRPLKTPMSAGQDNFDIWTVRNNLRSRYDLNSWRQP